MNGQICGRCGTPWATGAGPACGCAARAVQAVQAERSVERTMEIARAEDFDPLRIRPYVELDSRDAPPGAFRTAGPLPPLAPETAGAARRPVVPPPSAPFPDERRPQRRPLKAVAIGLTAVAVLGTAAFAGGLFSGGDDPDEALADSTRTGVPDGLDTQPAAATPSASPSPSVSPTTPPSAAATTPRAVPKTPRATPKAPAPPSREAKTPAARAQSGAGLREGDSGPEVVALQQRLKSLWLYQGQADGQYDQGVASSVRIYQMYRHIDGDPQGVYGPYTQRALEAEQPPTAGGAGVGSGAGAGSGSDSGGHNGFPGRGGHRR